MGVFPVQLQEEKMSKTSLTSSQLVAGTQDEDTWKERRQVRDLACSDIMAEGRKTAGETLAPHDTSHRSDGEDGTRVNQTYDQAHQTVSWGVFSLNPTPFTMD